MDTFDEFNQTTETTETVDEQDSNKQGEDLFGSDFTANTTVASSGNPFSNVQQEHSDNSWVIDDILTDTAQQNNVFDNDTLGNLSSAPQTTLFGEDIFTNQSNTNELETYPTPNLPLTADELFYNGTERRSSENSLSFNMFTNPVSASSTTTTTTTIVNNQFNSTENFSRLQAFNARRQQEIAEMEVIEKQKIEELRQQGKKELERWYEDRRRHMEQKRQSMKQEQDVSLTKALEKSDKETCDWAKVIRFLEFSQGTQVTKQKRDINRMRAVIIQAKRDKEVRKSENGV